MKRYAKDFLLSLRENESCKLLPPNLDPILFRDSPSPEIVDSGGGNKFVSREVPDWRNRGSAGSGGGGNGGGGLLPHNSSQTRRRSGEDEGGFKGPSSWGNEAGGHLRGNRPGGMQQAPGQSRWEHRGSNDREREQGDSGGTRPRFAWSGSEHDGLLGSGGGLRGPYPGGRASDRYNNNGGRGARTNDSRSNKPNYRNDSDDLDGETFGDKSSTKDRAEEERRRREEFESMRKEQQRMKEQKKPEKLDEKSDENSTSPGVSSSETKSDVSSTPAAPAPTPRPLVPPGFSQANLQKPSLKNDKKELAADEPGDGKPPQAVDPVAIACSITEGDVFTLTDLTESSKSNLIDKIFSKPGSAPTPQSEKLETRTSKFAHLFNFEDESSLLTSPRSPLAETKASDGGMLPMPVAPSVEDVEKNLEKSFKLTSSTPQAGKTFLTCEDIEQSLLAEARYEKGTPESSSRWKKAPDAAPDANAASRHLLSLLQKPASSEQDVEPEPQETPATLEALFGMSFMMELRSKDAPLSVKAVSETRSEILKPGICGDKTLDVKAMDSEHQHWASLWGGKPENPRSNTLEFGARENGEWRVDAPEGAAGAAAGNGELDSGVLNDFLKFKKAMNHRNKVNDSFLGMIDDQATPAVSSERFNSEAPPAAAGAPGLYRSHSPPLINQRSSLQLQQLKQVLVAQGSKLKQQQQQFQQQNGDLNPENRFLRARPQLSRQQQQQAAMFEAQQQHLVGPPQGFPPGMFGSSKQRPLHHHHQQPQHHLPAGYFPPGAAVLPPHIAPYGHLQHHPHSPHAGFAGVFPGPNEVFMDHPAAASAAGGENRWVGREAPPHHSAAAAGVPGLFHQQQQPQQKPGFGMNKLGYP